MYLPTPLGVEAESKKSKGTIIIETKALPIYLVSLFKYFLITIFSQYIEILIQWIVRVFCLLCGAVVVVAAVVVVLVAGAVVAVVVGRGVVATSDWWIVYWLTSLSQQLIVLYIILIVLYIIFSMSIRFVVFYSF